MGERDEEWHDDDPMCEESGDPEPCDHEGADIDTIAGRAHCYRCGEAWWASCEEIEAEIAHQAAYAEWVAEQEQPWSRFKEWLRSWPAICWDRIRFAVKWGWRQRPIPVSDDEIPF